MRKIVSLLTLLLFISVVALAQSKISGIVKDQNGDPVPFATINVKGSKVTVAADANANFTIPAKAGDVLTVSAVGLQSATVSVGAESTVSVVLTRVAGSISDVIVTTALGVQRQERSLGYSTAKITGAELTQAKVTNIATGLAGKVSGLQVSLVNNSVNPAVRVTLRGNRSILGNNQALLVVDGNILPINFLNSINPNDVESTNFLKGASASALYGSAASNGVIIVTTKRGSKGKPQINISSTASIQEIAYTAKFQNRFGQGSSETPAGVPGLDIGSGLTYFPENPFQPYVWYENQNYGPEFNGQQVSLGQPVRIFNKDGSYIDSFQQIKYAAKPDAKLGFFNKGVTFQNDVSYSSGDDNGTFYMSFEDLNVKGVIPNDINHRNTFRINGSRIYNRFTANYNISYAITHTNTTPGTYVPFRWGNSDYQGADYQATYTINNSGTAPRASGGSYFQGRPLYWNIVNQPADVDLRGYRNWKTDPFASPDGYFNAYYGNPWWQIDQSRLDERNNDFIGSASLNFKATDWLNITYRFGYARNDYNNKYTKAGYVFADWAATSDYGSNAGSIPVSLAPSLDPTGGDAFSYNQRLTSDFYATFNKSFLNGDLAVTFIAGNQVQANKFRAASLTANVLVIPDFYNINSRVGEPGVAELEYASRTFGIFGDLTLGYKNFLFGHVSLRNDWSSLLSDSNRSFLYPAGDISFVFSDLIKNRPAWWTSGKLRGALSRTAQVSIQPYSLTNTFSVGTGFPYGSPGFSVGDRYNNPDIKPEFTTEREIGLELAFLKNRITFSAAFYKANTTNQTIPINISPSTGFTSATVNSGEMENKGVELDLNGTLISNPGNGLSWNVGIHYAYNRNRVLSLGYGLNSVYIGGNNSYAVIGNPYPVLKGNDWERDPQGHIIVDRLSGEPSLVDTLVNFGTANPPTTIGLTTSFSFKGFTLNVVADGRFGAVIYNDLGQDLDFTGVSWYSTQSGRQPFVMPNSVYAVGDNKYAQNTDVTTKDGNLQFWANLWNTANSNYVSSADFWKLREVSLTYDFPRTLLDQTKFIKGISIGVVGRNLAVWKSKGNVWSDPEYSNTIGNGIGTTDINQTPPTRYYGVNVNVTF